MVWLLTYMRDGCKQIFLSLTSSISLFHVIENPMWHTWDDLWDYLSVSYCVCIFAQATIINCSCWSTTLARLSTDKHTTLFPSQCHSFWENRVIVHICMYPFVALLFVFGFRRPGTRCICSTIGSCQWNGGTELSIHKEFFLMGSWESSWNTRERPTARGDPIPPMLFILAMDPLQRILQWAFQRGIMHPVSGRAGGIKTSL
jgi:hypothetical protein